MASSTSRKKTTYARASNKTNRSHRASALPARIRPELQRALTIASVAALKSFIETWNKESPSTIPQPLRIVHEVMEQLGDRHHG